MCLSHRFWEDFHSPEHIEGGLPKPGIQVVFRDRCKPCPLGFVMEMTDPKILLDNVAHLGNLFVTGDFSVGQFGRGRVFPHDTVSNLVF